VINMFWRELDEMLRPWRKQIMRIFASHVQISINATKRLSQFAWCLNWNLMGQKQYKLAFRNSICGKRHSMMIVRWVCFRQHNFNMILCTTLLDTIHNCSNNNNPLIIPMPNRIRQHIRDKQKHRQNSIPPYFTAKTSYVSPLYYYQD
jgi:hypothetical protein